MVINLTSFSFSQTNVNVGLEEGCLRRPFSCLVLLNRTLIRGLSNIRMWRALGFTPKFIIPGKYRARYEGRPIILMIINILSATVAVIFYSLVSFLICVLIAPFLPPIMGDREIYRPYSNCYSSNLILDNSSTD